MRPCPGGPPKVSKGLSAAEATGELPSQIQAERQLAKQTPEVLHRGASEGMNSSEEMKSAP